MKSRIATRILEQDIDYGYRYEIQTKKIHPDGTEDDFRYGISLYSLTEILELRDVLNAFLVSKGVEYDPRYD